MSVRLIVALRASLVALGDRDDRSGFRFPWTLGLGRSPAAVSDSLPYIVTIDVAGGDRGLDAAVKDASSLYKLIKDAPPDGESLARRATNDFAPLIDALWGAGYYNATVTIAIDGAALTIASSDIAAFARAADAIATAPSSRSP